MSPKGEGGGGFLKEFSGLNFKNNLVKADFSNRMKIVKIA
jgi:hypothetical protein